MVIIISSVIGLILYGIFNYFFIMEDSPRIVKILLGVISLIPFIGAVGFLVTVIVGIFCHCHPSQSLVYKGDKFPIRDTKLNRWLFNDLDWEKYDKIRNFNSKYNTNKE